MGDYYSIMSVLPAAPPEAIKKAYRRLAKELHPDRNHAPDAEDQFKSLVEAYEVLSNPAKRAKYDCERADGSVVADAIGLSAIVKAKNKALSLLHDRDFDGLFMMGRNPATPGEARELAQDWAVSLGFEKRNIPGLEEIAGCQEFREKAREDASYRINTIWASQKHYGKIFHATKLPGVRGKAALVDSLRIVADLLLKGKSEQLLIVAEGDFHDNLREAAGKGAARVFSRKGDTVSIGKLKTNPKVLASVREYAEVYEKSGPGLEKVRISQDTSQPYVLRVFEGMMGVKLLAKAGDRDNLVLIARKSGEFWSVPEEVWRYASEALAAMNSAPRAPRGRGTDGDFQSPHRNREPLAAAARTSGQKMKA
jgi:curved DNA-binding protein CbpA